MDSLEELKQELKLQKTAIENKGGVVQTTYTHPSPSEITAGINTIEKIDTTLATATSNDVKNGKTFYAGNSTLKTGTYVAQDSQEFKDMYLFENPTSDTTFYYEPESYQTTIRPYLFCTSPHKMVVTLNSNIEEIGDCAFGYIDDLTVYGLENATSLTSVGNYALMNATNIDLGNLPSTLVTIGEGAFANAGTNSTNIVIPSAVTSAGVNSYANLNEIRSYHTNFNINSTSIQTLEENMLAYRMFNCDFYPPANIKTIKEKFNYGGSFNNITIPATVETLEIYCFFAKSSDPVELFNLETITFLSPEPPSIYYSLFANQVLGKAKMYVPDEGFDAYYTTTYLQLFRPYMYPLSEKET